MKRIIVEGPDGAGKTTLVHGLMTNFPVLAYVRNEKSSEQDFNKWWPDTLNVDMGPYIPVHDRFFYSELVYGPVIRGNIKADPHTIRAVREQLRQGALLIYARPPVDIVRKGLEGREQMKGVYSNIQRLIEEYDHLMMEEATFFGDRFIRYDWTEMRFLSLYGRVKEYIEAR